MGQAWGENNAAYCREYWRTDLRRQYLKRLSRRELDHLAKVKVLMNYSNPQGTPVCNNCGEQDIDVLCIDHINGGGRQHRLQEHIAHQAHWLIKSGLPEGYQVLCSNCNLKKSMLERDGRQKGFRAQRLRTIADM